MVQYLIHVAYEDEIYGQGPENTDFYIRDEDRDFFTDYEKAKKMWNKLVAQNEQFIQENKKNTYYLMEFIQIDGKKSKVLCSKRYD